MDHAGAAVVAVDATRPDEGVVDLAARLLVDGGVVAFPTETVYGLGAAVGRADAVERVFRMKARPATDPLIVHVPDATAAAGVAAVWDDRAEALAARFWPGPLTLVLPRSREVPDAVTAGLPAVGVRVPAHPVALALLTRAAVPVAAPSANRFGRVSPTTAAHVVAELGGAPDLVLDGGPTPLGIESTVVDLTGPTARVLRPGGVTSEELAGVVGRVDAPEREVVAESSPARGPGRFLGHYAPSTPVVLVEGDDELRRSLVGRLRERGVRAVALELPADGPAAAPRLYAALRRADRADADVVLALVVDPAGVGRAVNDRLFRAAHGRVVGGDAGSDVDRVAALVGA